MISDDFKDQLVRRFDALSCLSHHKESSNVTVFYLLKRDIKRLKVLVVKQVMRAQRHGTIYVSHSFELPHTRTTLK